MPRFQGHLQHIFVDGKKFTKTFDDAAKVLIRQAAREWLRAAVLNVPVWTGMARGSLAFARGPGGNLSRFLNVAVPINPVSATPRWYSQRIPKTPESGGRFAIYNFTSGNSRYGFTFRSDVIHFIINEFFTIRPVSRTSPWKSMEAGAEAFRTYMKNHVGNLPRIESSMIRIQIPFGK